MSSEAAQAKLDFVVHMPSTIRRDAEAYSEKQGVSLDEFINAAVAEKLIHLQHEEWVRNRKPATPESRAAALALLDRMGSDEVEPGDEIPEDYVRTYL